MYVDTHNWKHNENNSFEKKVQVEMPKKDWNKCRQSMQRTSTSVVRFDVLLNNITHIKKYDSYFLSRDWAGSKWHPVLKVWKKLQDKYCKVMQNAYTCRLKP